MPITRTSLLLRLRNDSDPTGWREFVQLYEPLLRHAARRAGIREHDVPDIVQDILIRLLRAIPQFRYCPERGRFRAWLRSVCRTSIIDWRRREHRAAGASLTGEDALAPPIDEQQWELEHRRHVLLHAMGETRRQVSRTAWECFEQYVVSGRDAAAVASDLDITPAAVYVIASRIRARIRCKCQQFDEDLA